MNHTYEVRINMKSLEKKTKTVFEGNEKQCYDYLNKIAEKRGIGVSFLLGNGNFDLICLEDEVIAKIRAVAPELLDELERSTHLLEAIRKNHKNHLTITIDRLLEDVITRQKHTIQKVGP